MTHESSHGAGSRTPVVHGGRRVRGLHQRTLKDGRVVYEARLRIDGKDSTKVLAATTKTDAVREYEALRVDRARGHVHENRLLNPTVSDVCDELLAHLRARVDSRDERFRVALGTVWNYEKVLPRLVSVLGWKRIADVDIVDIRRFVDTLRAKGFAPSTSKATLGITSRVFAFAIKQGYVDRNVVRDLDRDERPGGKRATEPRYLTEDEIKRLLDAVLIHHRALIACCAYAGLRSGEVRGLQWGDIDFDEGRIAIMRQVDPSGRRILPPKTLGSRASVPILPALHRELFAHRQRMAETNIAWIHSERFAFVRVRRRGVVPEDIGMPFAANCVYVAVRRAGDEAGLNPPGLPPVGVHDLRHSFVANAFQHEATLPEIAELARHSNPQITLQVYAGLTKDGRGRAAQKLLDAGFGV